jgi:hypothetical protein
MNNVITKEQANAVFDILIEECKAQEFDRDQFVRYMTTDPDDGFKEFRFGGTLGFGGKCKLSNGSVYTSYYAEDHTEARMAASNAANRRIDDLMAQQR